MERAVIYARFSSHNQREESIDAQLRECRQYAERNGFEIVGEYCDRAVTGRTENRDSLNQMIREAAKGHWNAVLVYKLDRLSRDRYGFADIRRRLRNMDVRVVSVKEAIPDGPEGIILESMLEGMAEYYSANLSQNIRRGMEENALNCKSNGMYLLGYRVEDHRYVVDEEEARIVRRVFTEYAAGKRLSDIADGLNRDGYRSRKGALFNKNSFGTILRQERYKGIYIYRDIRVEGGMPRIIDDELFDEVQRMLKRKAHAPRADYEKVQYLLSGKVYCGICGERLVGNYSTGKSGRRFYYYTCAGKRRHSCTLPALKKSQLEDWVMTAASALLHDDRLVDRIAEAVEAYVTKINQSNDDLNQVTARLATCHESLTNIMKALESGIVSKTVQRRLSELETEEEELTERKAELEAAKLTISRDEVRAWLKDLRQLPAESHSLLTTLTDIFIKAIYVYEDSITVFYHYQMDDGADSISQQIIWETEENFKRMLKGDDVCDFMGKWWSTTSQNRTHCLLQIISPSVFVIKYNNNQLNQVPNIPFVEEQ